MPIQFPNDSFFTVPIAFSGILCYRTVSGAVTMPIQFLNDSFFTVPIAFSGILCYNRRAHEKVSEKD